jgi:CubicO group peptidase (beta-lactamase class C family)
LSEAGPGLKAAAQFIRNQSHVLSGTTAFFSSATTPRDRARIDRYATAPFYLLLNLNTAVLKWCDRQERSIAMTDEESEYGMHQLAVIGGRIRRVFVKRAIVILMICMSFTLPTLAQQAKYFPHRGEWQRKSPAELGFDAAKLGQAVAYAQANGSSWNFDKDQVRLFGPLLGPVPKSRAATNGIIIRHGYVAAEFGDIKANDPAYNIAKSFLGILCGLAVERGLIHNVNDSVARYIHDGGYQSAHNVQITWKEHLQETSEWDGSMWGKNSDFVGAQEFGASQQPARTLQAPGSYMDYNDVRINRFSLSLLRVFQASLPAVLKGSIMDPIGASEEWQWIPYKDSYVEIRGAKIGSVSGGTRWGGGLWMNSEDLARFGLLVLNHGHWGDRQLVPAKWISEAVSPSERQPTYGYLWWLNTNKKMWPSAPVSSFAAIGNGVNLIWVDPDDDIVLVWRWFAGDAMDGMISRILEALRREK